ncbi:MAG: 6,7-dimethyl-8-ribityllumazine synthase [Bacteroidetes bacterium]|nr:6,7-dimethyl-8-ribityllumazine synthase [Bacteroidota bacterium]
MKILTGDKSKISSRIGIIISRFNTPVTENLLAGALDALKINGIDESFIEVFYVPGAFEIPPLLKKLCRLNSEKKRFDGILTIGCVIKGGTAHFEFISTTVTQNIGSISAEYEIPVGFCVLTCYTPLQAFERSGMPPNAENNKGYEAAESLLEMISLMNKF